MDTVIRRNIHGIGGLLDVAFIGNILIDIHRKYGMEILLNGIRGRHNNIAGAVGRGYLCRIQGGVIRLHIIEHRIGYRRTTKTRRTFFVKGIQERVMQHRRHHGLSSVKVSPGPVFGVVVSAIDGIAALKLGMDTEVELLARQARRHIPVEFQPGHLAVSVVFSLLHDDEIRPTARVATERYFRTVIFTNDHRSSTLTGSHEELQITHAVVFVIAVFTIRLPVSDSIFLVVHLVIDIGSGIVIVRRSGMVVVFATAFYPHRDLGVDVITSGYVHRVVTLHFHVVICPRPLRHKHHGAQRQ